MKKKILLIDDDLDLCSLLNRFLSRYEYEIEEAHSGARGIQKFKDGEFDIVICDYRLGDMEGIEVLKAIKMHQPAAFVLFITGYSDIQTAVEVIKFGAYDYITKPLVPGEVLNILKTYFEKTKTGNQHDEKLNRGDKPGGNEIYVKGQSKRSTELNQQIEIIAATDYGVILYGGNGVGKAVVAKAIHNRSKRKNKPFYVVDCGRVSKESAETEFFGNGASRNEHGYFELANSGTLFLDEVCNLSHDLQALLLRAMQSRRFKKIGSSGEIPFDIRIIVASGDSLMDACKNGILREDLYHQFNQFSIHIPSLQERRDDIPLFADFFLKRVKRELGKQIVGFEDNVMGLFVNYSWPGNLRELGNVIRRAALLANGNKITLDSLPGEIKEAEKRNLLQAAVQKIE